MFLRRLSSPFVLFCLTLLGPGPKEAFAAAKSIHASVIVNWEGRPIEEMNLAALSSFRREFPDIPIVHMINPSYFQKNAQENLAMIGRTAMPQDEVGLYLAPMHGILKTVEIMTRTEPTFWGYTDESSLCSDDCGLQVPLSTYSREEVLKIFWQAHKLMQGVGFQELRTFAIRGWQTAPGVEELARVFAYTHDMTRIDPELVRSKLRDFPVARWLQSPDFITPPKGQIPAALVQKGGVIEFNRVEDLLKSLEKFPSDSEQSLFSLVISQESLFMNGLRLSRGIRALRAKAEESKADLLFSTVSGTKNSRPLLEKVRLSGRL